MARTRSITPTRKRSEGNFLAGMGVGVLVGLMVSLAIAFYLNGGTSSKPAPIAGLPQGGATPPVASATPEKPKFDFYRILPGAEEPVTEKEIRERLRQKGSPAGQQEASKDVYFIQAGSFQNPADADNQKARLAILGFESSVEPANLPDKGTWYRVRMGPYAKLEEINKVRQVLGWKPAHDDLTEIVDAALNWERYLATRNR